MLLIQTPQVHFWIRRTEFLAHILFVFYFNEPIGASLLIRENIKPGPIPPRLRCVLDFSASLSLPRLISLARSKFQDKELTSSTKRAITRFSLQVVD